MVAKPQTDSALARLYRLMARVREAEKARVTGLLTNDAFEEQLSLERARTDRSGQPFVLIVFNIQFVQNDDAMQAAEQALAAALVDRTRMCDAKGYYGEQIAAILPYTSKADATNILEPLEFIFRRKLAEAGADTAPSPKLSFVVYEYPDDERKKLGSRALRGKDAATNSPIKMRLHHVS
jgi:GGDEF domain-containing protein